MRIQPKYIQLVGDALIPLAGFFFWEWSLYFILLFYFLDILASEVIMHLKSSKIITYQGKPTKSVWAMYGVVSFLMVIIALVLVHVTVLLIHPSIHFWDELVKFWTYKELGIQQGYLLFPIIAFGAYQQYKLYFLAPAKQRTMRLQSMWKNHLKAFALIVAISGLFSVVSLMIILPELSYVVLVVAGVAAYRFFFPAH